MAILTGCQVSAQNKAPPADVIQKSELNGAAAAKAEIEAGSFIWLLYSPPLPPGFSSPEERVLLRHGIKAQIVGDVFDPVFDAYLKAHNKVVHSALEAKYGREFWTLIDSEVANENGKTRK